MIVGYLIFLLSIYFISATGHHTCKFKYIEGGVRHPQRYLIVNEHNNFRKLVANGKLEGQPKGINLKKMRWDTKLAREAQKIADTCVYGHVPVNDTRWSVGQNLFRRQSTEYKKGADWTTALQAWRDEYKLYTYGSNITRSTGHYTQMVWATTQYVGCAYAFYESDGQMKYEKYYVCHYGPGGNYAGELPYKTGSNGCANLC